MKTIITAYHPYDNGKNDYLKLSRQAISKAEYSVIKMDKLSALKTIFHCKGAIRLINLNWFDEISAASHFKERLKTFKRKCFIMLMKMSGVKIVTTIHNRVPHTSTGYTNSNFRLWLMKKSDAIIQLSHDTSTVLQDQTGFDWKYLKKKIFTVPHPNYSFCIDEYSHFLRKDMGWDNSQFVIISTGLIRPYKNIEIIIEAAKRLQKEKNILFYVVGDAYDTDYTNSLLNKVESLNNIAFDFRFVENKELYAMIEAADICLYPYNVRSSLNSSNCLLCCTLGKTCIIPEIGTVHELNSKDIFSYSYENEPEHINAVVQNILKAYNEWKISPEEFTKHGSRLKSLVEERYSIEKTARRYAHLYSKLLR